MPRPAVFRNLGTKLLALAIAILIWFVFSAQQRERISERSYRIPLSIANVPPGSLIASPLPPTVEVRLRGPFTALRQLDPVKLEALVDLTDAPRGERIHRLAPEDINVPQAVEVIAIAPSEIRVALDTIAEKSLPIVARVTGKPAEGYEVAEVLVEPRVARLNGPASALSAMNAVETDPISLANRAASFSEPATVIAEAPGVRVREGQVVTVTVHLRAVAVPVVSPAPAPRRKTAGR
jgi:YbbR domain-containing protein